MLLRLADGVSGYTVADEVGCCVQTVYQVRRRYVEQGLATALGEALRSGGPRRFDGAQRAALTALACTPAPVGHRRWTLRLLADKAAERCLVETISHETVAQVLKKRGAAPAPAARVPGRSERRLSGPQGGRAGRLRAALRPALSGGLFR